MSVDVILLLCRSDISVDETRFLLQNISDVNIPAKLKLKGFGDDDERLSALKSVRFFFFFFQ